MVKQSASLNRQPSTLMPVAAVHLAYGAIQVKVREKQRVRRRALDPELEVSITSFSVAPLVPGVCKGEGKDSEAERYTTYRETQDSCPLWCALGSSSYVIGAATPSRSFQRDQEGLKSFVLNPE